jgi:8-amino-7-oxononanoate synthase
VRYLDAVRAAVADLDARTLRRTLRASLPPGAIDFASNDYLGLARDPRVIAALRAADRVGSGGSRLLSGAHEAHAALEADLAAWTGRESALLFSSGYLAALGAIVTLAPFATHAYSDARNHACAIDALRLTKLPRTILAPGALPPRARRDGPAMIVTESRFGMSGKRVDPAALLGSLGPDDVLVVDEAHALGIDGPAGAGVFAPYADSRIVVIGTLSKALAGAGGFVAAPAPVIDLLVTAARSFIFDTSSPPGLVAAVHAALRIVRGADGERLRARLAANIVAFREALARANVPIPPPEGPIVRIHVGDDAEAVALGKALEARGIFAPAIRPPTVPRGEAQLRITLRADHTPAELDAFVTAFAAARAAYA